MITFGSLFAGIGGFDLGLERAGMKCVWQVENDPSCIQILEKHWLYIKRFKDIKECKSDELQTVDLICGGFPCQPFSLTGRRRGKEDDRNLWPEMFRIIREKKPTWVVAENVPGVVKMELDNILSDLEGEEYTCWTFIIPACAVDAKHRRDRLWILAHTNSQGLEKRACERENLCKKWQTIERSGLQGAVIWSPEPGLGRMVDGFSSRVDRHWHKERLKMLGNAVVPQVVEVIGRIILAIHKE